MKSRGTFQTVILLALAPVLAVLTAVWAWQLYRTTEHVILQGFDRKLLAIAGSTAALIDGDLHEQYQARQRVGALAPARTGLIGWSDASGLVAINPATGGARATATPAGTAVRGLVSTLDAGRSFALTAGGESLIELEAATGQVVRTIALTQPVDGVFADDHGLGGWRGTQVLRLDLATGGVVPQPVHWPEPLRSVVFDPTGSRLVGLTADAAALVIMDGNGALVRRLALVAPAPADGATAGARPLPPISALAWSEGRLLAAGPSLLQVDPATGQISAGGFTVGYFDVAHPFYRAQRPAFIQFQRDAGLTYLYSQVYEGDRKIYYVMDGTTSDSYSRPGTADDVPDAMVESAERVQFLGHSQVSGIQQWEPWGLVKSGFAPIRNGAGKVVAMAGADVDISVIRAKSRGSLFAAIFIGVASVLAAGFVSYRIARTLTRPLQELKETALWIAAGHYGAELKSSGTREVSLLARHLDSLRLRLAEEGDRVYRWQDEILDRRAQTALAQSLAEGGRPVEARSSYQHHDDFVLWLEAAEPDAVTAACVRARAGVLAQALIRSGHTTAELPALLLDTEPDLIACAAWQDSAKRLHYRARGTVPLQLDGVEQSLQGHGSLELARRPMVRWSAAAATRKGVT